MKQFRAVYQYSQGTIRGAGACFAIAPTEEDARKQIADAMPGVTITQIREEQEDPLAVYERRPVLSVVRAENLPAAELEQKLPTCELCEALLVIGPEVQRRVCADCEAAGRIAERNAFADRWS